MSQHHQNAIPDTPPSGLLFAICAYLIWGLLPLYLMFVHHVPPFEFVGWRIIFTLPVCLLVVALRRQGGEVLAAIAQPRTLIALTASALLIGANWLIYTVAIQAGHVFAASLGYYMNPLVNVLAGTLFLGERLTRRQWVAVALAAAGVSLLAWDARGMLGISLGLAFSFCGYGLVRKLVPVGALPGVTVETLVLTLPALAVLAWQAQEHGQLALGASLGSDMLIAMSGVTTAVPLLLFAVAARRMDYSTLGFIQFMSPTLIFVMGLTVFHEPLRPMQLACFVAIWTAIVIFVWDLLARRAARA